MVVPCWCWYHVGVGDGIGVVWVHVDDIDGVSTGVIVYVEIVIGMVGEIV